MKKILAIMLSIVMVVSAVVVSVSAQEIDVTNEFLNAVCDKYSNVEKEDIYIRYLKALSGDNYLVRYSVSNTAVPGVMKEIILGDYCLYTSMPVPQIYSNGVIYDLEDAYSQDVIGDDDLYIMSTFDELNMVVSKITRELQEGMRRFEMDEYVNVRFEVKGSEKTLYDIENWIDDISGALEILKAHYEEIHKKLVEEVLKDIDHIEKVHNNGISIIAVKRADVEKVAESDFVTEMDFVSDIHMRFIEDFEPPLDEYDYEEKCADEGENGENHYYLIKASIGMTASAEIGFRFGDHVVHSSEIHSPFNYGFGIYDVSEDKFYDVYDLKDSIDKYHRLEDHLAFYGSARPVGDSDGDRNLTILDATKIQRILADLDYPEHFDGYGPHISDGRSHYVSDFDEDGYVTVLDATAIQLKLAGF